MRNPLHFIVALSGVLAGGNLCGQPVADTNLLAAAAGRYAGLFYETNGVQHESSGWFQLSVARSGIYSGRILLGAKTRVFAGRFAPDGTTIAHLRIRGGAGLDLSLTLQTNTSQVTGTISNAAFIADVLADKVLTFTSTNPCPVAGRYTFLIENSDGSDPQGTGYGIATVGPRGTVTMLGTLADGRTITQTSFVGANGVWPLYEPLYGNRGSLLGWVNFEDRPTNDFNGQISWSRPGIKGGPLHSNGFTNEVLVVGSRYAAPPTATNSVLNFTNSGQGVMIFTGGSVASPFTNAVTLLPRAKVMNQSTNRLQMSSNLPWGRFVGWVREPGTGAPHHFKGAVLQKANYGAGFFIDKNASGRVYLGPVPEPEPEPQLALQP